MSWQELRLGDAFRVKHGFALKSQYFSERGEYVVLTPGNFKEEGGFRARPGKDRFYTGDVSEEYVLNDGDLIIAMTEQGPGLLGSSAWIPDSGRFLHNQRLGLVQDLNEAILDKKFLYYLFNTRPVRSQISGSATGTKVKHTAPERIYRVEVKVPLDVSEQRRIAAILSAYDDLIENNRRRIQLLEQAARLLYQDWFVHLRFPGHEHVKITDGVPEGWEVTTLANVCASLEDGDWIESKDQGGDDYRLLQVSNIGDNNFVETGNHRHITEDTFRRLRCNQVLPGDILISRMPKPIGRAWYVHPQPWRMVTAVDVAIARPDPKVADPFYFLYHINSPAHIARCEARATGTTRPRISRKNMGGLPILRPSRPIQAAFGEVASSINQQRHVLTTQNDNLAQARDLLLPRLMNGEIAV